MKAKSIHYLHMYTRLAVCVIMFVSIHAHAQTDTSQYGKGLTRNMIEGGKYQGFLFTDVKGIRLQFNGYVQVDFIHDFMEMTNIHAFQPSTIPVPSSAEGNTAFSIRQSRFAFTAYGAPDARGRALKAVLEFDLWGSLSGAPRLRHAYIQHGKWTFGQYWSNFMDGDNWPNIMDYWGPNAYVWTRQVQLRFTQQLSSSMTFSVSAEQPGGDLSIPDTWSNRTIYPDVTAAFQKDFGDKNESHVRLAGLLHPMDYKNGDKEKKTSIGGAFNLSGNINVQKDNDIKFQFAYGSGYAKYSEDISGEGYDAYGGVNDKSVKNISMLATWLYYDHFWTKSLGSTIGWGYLQLNTPQFSMPAVGTIKSTNYGSFNTTYYFTNYFKIAGEVLYGIRKDTDNKTGDNLRGQFSAFFKF
ncbi:hypothetical protein CLV51_1011308 [Chitinophaga niastensis]|uniref:Porin n=1 Tax=Chitinophaga niastensis TaxID=536980 RepID=A0A2P8HUR1_CHINA|nr:DcaP family trimeric outer membrane transporter [Chitinophaga niastensis]PSL49966.1 hypothetical protein CLV51_1011308 [Chitinophaga niastensis]